MSEPARIPVGHVHETPYSIEVGERVAFDVSMPCKRTPMAKDGSTPLASWLHVETTLHSSQPELILEKLDDGTFKADLTKCHGYTLGSRSQA